MSPAIPRDHPDRGAPAQRARPVREGGVTRQGVLEAVFERTRNAMLIAGDDRVYLDCNHAAEILFECSREQILGRRIDDFTPAQVRDRIPVAWATFLSRGALEGSYVLLTGRAARVAVECRATANFLPGLHLSIYMPQTRAVTPGRDAAGRSGLTPRERQILAHIALGASGQEIAAIFVISPATVRTHLRNILVKLGAQTRSHAVAVALQRGEITPDVLGSGTGDVERERAADGNPA